MVEEYNPTKKEIVKEIGSGFKSTFSKENLKDFGKNLKDFGGYCGFVFSLVSIAPYIIPSTIRSLNEPSSPEDKETSMNKAEEVGAFTGLGGGVIGWFVQLGSYVHIADKYNLPEIGLIPVATNVLSGIYEFGRHSYKKAEKRLIERDKSKSLDSIAEKIA